MRNRTFSECDANLSPAEWDTFLQHCSHGHHEQSSRYGALRGAYGYGCDHVVVRQKGRVVAGAQILVLRTPIGKFAHILRGPLAIGDEPDLISRVVQKLELAANERGYTSVRADLFPNQTVAIQLLKRIGYCASTTWYRRKKSFVVPLCYNDEDLAKKMDKKVPYYLRRSVRKGLTVRAGGASLIDAFYVLHRETARYQAFPIFPRDYFKYVHTLFGASGKAQCFVAFHEGAPLAGIFNMVVDDTMYYGWGGMRRDHASRHIQPNYLLHMEAAAWARDQGCTVYDLSGNQRFKQQFAVETIPWPMPMRKFYGAVPTLHRKLFNLTGAHPMVQHLVTRAGKQFGILPKGKIPW